MATINNVVEPNFQPLTSTTFFNQIWRLTRALKKAGWKYIASGDGSTKESGTGDPELDLWGAGQVSNAGAGAASIADSSRGRSVVTGLSGIVAADKGRFLHISGAATGANNHYHQIEEVLSAVSVAIDARTFAAAADANNGALTWEVRDPIAVTETYPVALNAVAAWWCARGPSVLKIPFTVAPSGALVKGENVVQASTGAEGELVGYVYSTTGASGYLVVAPRLRGTGAGAYGWDTGNAVTGDVSGESITQNGTALEYRHEVVFWKATNLTSGSMFLGCFEPVGDTAETFTTLSAAAGCTATVAPGGGGAGNAFPTHAFVNLGSSTSGGHLYWANNNANVANAQIICADTIEEQDHTADGSWIVAIANTGATAVGGHAGIAFFRTVDPDGGDLDPYVAHMTMTNTLYNHNRTGTTNTNATLAVDLWKSRSRTDTSKVGWRGWRCRGLADEAFLEFENSVVAPAQSSGSSWSDLGDVNLSDAERDLTAPSDAPVRNTYPVWINCVQTGNRVCKGVLKWMRSTTGGLSLNTYDSKAWVQLSSGSCPFIAGPWDGTSTPYYS